VLRWFRLLVIALLLPAYGLAAIGSPAFATHDAQASVGEEPPTTDGDISALIDELGDTTDDMSDHCPSRSAAATPRARPPALPHLGRRLTVDAPLAKPLRPPRTVLA